MKGPVQLFLRHDLNAGELYGRSAPNQYRLCILTGNLFLGEKYGLPEQQRPGLGVFLIKVKG